MPDPFLALGWAVPLILLAPLAAFIFAISGIRTRRAASAMSLLGAFVMLGATALSTWALIPKAAPFVATSQWINASVAFSGPLNFQSFGIDIVLHVDHMTLFALLVVEICAIAALLWHRVLGRNEQGPARFHALVSVLLFGAAGTLVSWDLAELVGFWGLTAAATYLLLAHRWGADAPARNARIALVLPFVTDLSLLSGVAVLYSRYGKNNLNDLLPILHTFPNWTVRQLVVASILLFIGCAGRMAIWPLQGWMTGTAATSPPAASALTQAVWSVLGVTVLWRVMPILVDANPQTLRACLYMCGTAAVVAPLLSLLGNEPRRVLALAGSGVTALGGALVIHGFQGPQFVFGAAGVAIVLAAAPARLAAGLAVSGIASAMRTDHLSEMGNALKVMRRSATVLLASALVPGLCAAGAVALAVSSRTRLGLAVGEAVFLIALGFMRVFLAVAFGPLRRRRAFEPDRVREVPNAAVPPLVLALVAAGMFGVLAFSTRWIDLLDGNKHSGVHAGTYVLWLIVAGLGFASAVFAYTRAKDAALRASSGIGAWVGARLATGGDALGRFVFRPTAGVAGEVADRLPQLELSLGASLVASGRLALAASALPVLSVLLVLAVLLAYALGLLAPGLYK